MVQQQLTECCSQHSMVCSAPNNFTIAEQFGIVNLILSCEVSRVMLCNWGCGHVMLPGVWLCVHCNMIGCYYGNTKWREQDGHDKIDSYINWMVTPCNIITVYVLDNKSLTSWINRLAFRAWSTGEASTQITFSLCSSYNNIMITTILGSFLHCTTPFWLLDGTWTPQMLHQKISDQILQLVLAVVKGNASSHNDNNISYYLLM